MESAQSWGFQRWSLPTAQETLWWFLYLLILMLFNILISYMVDYLTRWWRKDDGIEQEMSDTKMLLHMTNRLISDMKTMLVSVESEKDHHLHQMNKERHLMEKMTELQNKSYAKFQEEIDLMKTLIKLQIGRAHV
jgi:hypothetical protein